MLIVIVLVFLGVFVVAALLLIASGTGASQQTKRTLTVLQAALTTPTPHRLTLSLMSANKICSAPFPGSIECC